jgi:hypothetical protein
MTDDMVLRLMIEKGVPLTRQNYLDIAYMGAPPDEIGGEIEASIPKEIREAEEEAAFDFPFDASGCCPACGDTTDAESLLCDDCADMVRSDPRTSVLPCQDAEEFIAREEQKVIENLWSSRNAFTVADREWLAELKVECGDPCGLELNGLKTGEIVERSKEAGA